jgi:hypothetical protein
MPKWSCSAVHKLKKPCSKGRQSVYFGLSFKDNSIKQEQPSQEVASTPKGMEVRQYFPEFYLGTAGRETCRRQQSWSSCCCSQWALFSPCWGRAPLGQPDKGHGGGSFLGGEVAAHVLAWWIEVLHLHNYTYTCLTKGKKYAGSVRTTHISQGK